MADLNDVVGRMLSGDYVFMAAPPGMVNHINRYGLLTKKTPDGSRQIRCTTNPGSLLDPTAGGRKPTDAVYVSHDPESTKHLFCGFNHGVHETTYGNNGRSEKIHATMSLAQLREMSKLCVFCHVLTEGVYRFCSLWQPKLEKFKYLDALIANRARLGKDEFLALLDASDQGHFDSRFTNDTLTDSEVALYISMDSGEGCLEVNVQKYPPPERRRMLPLEKLEVFKAEDTWLPWPVIATRPEVSVNVLSDECITKIHGWVRDCVETHQYCDTKSSRRETPSRLLEVTSQGSRGLTVRLINADPRRTYKYAALSHSWSSSKPLKMTRANYATLQRGIPWDEMSQVLKDTCVLANALSITYVWIDSLCIIQQDAEDWEKEACRMGLVYSNAYIVFAALGGWLALEKEPAEKVEITGVHTGTQTELGKFEITFRRKPDHDNFVNSANDGSGGEWFLRAWCFQERLFASRILHFGGSLEDITFECNQHLKCECGGVEDLSPIKRTNSDGNQFSSVWCHLKARSMRELNRIGEQYPDPSRLDPRSLAQLKDRLFVLYIALCEDFTPKHFSFPTDTLPALSSLASRLGPYMGAFHGGLWEHRILLGLQWETFDVRRSQRIQEFCAPTYSWASRTGGVVWYLQPERLLRELDNCEFAEVIKVCSEPAQESLPYGKVETSYIYLRGWQVSGHILCESGDEEGRLKLALPGGEAYVQMDCQDDINDIRRLNRDGAERVVCFELMRNRPGPNSRNARGIEQTFASAVVLVPVHRGCYRRVGFSIIATAVFDVESSYKDMVII